MAKTQEQPKCPPTDEWKKMWYIHTVGYYTAVYKGGTGPFVATRTHREMIILSEVSWKEKDKDRMIPLTCGIRNMTQMSRSMTRGFLLAQTVKSLPLRQEICVRSPVGKIP